MADEKFGLYYKDSVSGGYRDDPNKNRQREYAREN